MLFLVSFGILSLPQQQGGVGGGSASTDPSAAGSVVVHSGNAASDGCELQVATLERDGFG